MTNSTIAKKRNARAWRPRDAAGWLGLAASPTFALMAWLSATDAAPITLCTHAPGLLPLHGMAGMYLLMSLFHVSPWLNLASSRRRRFTHLNTETQGD